MKIRSTMLALPLVITCSMAFAEPASVSDSVITLQIKAKIAADKNLSVFSEDVSTVNNGVVVLSGVVDSETDATALVQLAGSVDGVRDVNTENLKVKDSQHPMNDAYITAKIKGQFIQAKILDNKDVAITLVSVETNDGVVHLSGAVDNDEQIKNAITLAKSVKGVTKVESRLTVKA